MGTWPVLSRFCDEVTKPFSTCLYVFSILPPRPARGAKSEVDHARCRRNGSTLVRYRTELVRTRHVASHCADGAVPCGEERNGTLWAQRRDVPTHMRDPRRELGASTADPSEAGAHRTLQPAWIFLAGRWQGAPSSVVAIGLLSAIESPFSGVPAIRILFALRSTGVLCFRLGGSFARSLSLCIAWRMAACNAR